MGCLTDLDGSLADYLPVVPQPFMFAVETSGFKMDKIAHDRMKMALSHKMSRGKYGSYERLSEM